MHVLSVTRKLKAAEDDFNPINKLGEERRGRIWLCFQGDVILLSTLRLHLVTQVGAGLLDTPLVFLH